MFQIAICDDSAVQLGWIHAAVKQYLADNPIWGAEIITFTSSLLFVESLDKNGGYDIALLDVCMPGILGTEVAREIRRRKDKTEIIFLTNSDEYAVDAFALKAAHYLLKPFTQAQFDEAMNRVMSHINTSAPKLLNVKLEGGEMRCVDIDEIQYMESNGHAVEFHLKTESCTESRRSITRLYKELEGLSPGQFIAPYKGFLVNQKAIVTIDSKGISLTGGARIPIRRGEFSSLQNQYLAYRFAKKNQGSDSE